MLTAQPQIESELGRGEAPHAPQFIRMHPWIAIAAAAVLGAAIGTLAGMERHKTR